ncbi:MAG: methyltransferase domain-containing protein [Parvibaculum sp.]|uniref:methyltransferase domain-containing protein n=1 Tax=Parvibaculum sp. TaxID=2024848 RepID=UPI00271F68C9|nr:methyltransferase domain-containing protein [Parvibaculum sp.]MDO8838945.1 methyltransferase domain-containing protein [Parvibaculum sp.]
MSPLFDGPADRDTLADAAPPGTAAAGDYPSTDDPLAEMERLIASGAREAAFAHAAAEAATWTAGRRTPGLAAALGRCLIDMGEPARAAALIEPLVAEGSAGTGALTTMARALGLCGRHQEALSLLNEASFLDGRSTEVLLALGLARLTADDIPRAIGDFERVLRLATGESDTDINARAEAHFRLGECWASMDEVARAARHFEAAQAHDPADLRGATIRLAEIAAAGPPKRASAAYVRALFDGYAPRYDTHMTGALAYRGPDILRDVATRAGLSASEQYAGIDLGCGTGLSGAAFRAFCATLTGVDLSPRMVAVAEASGHYDRVIAGDLLAFLAAETESSCTLAIACDTLIYLGDLAALFSGLARVLARGGWFVFSTEKSDAAEGGYAIGPTRRFRHTAAYLQDMAAAHGFEIGAIETAILRTEKRVAVESFVGVARRR